MFQFPGLAFVSLCIQDQIPSYDICKSEALASSDLSPSPRPASELQISKVGFPIRKSTDQSLFAAPHGLSQRTTSFIASQRQGIHRIPLRHLIALIIDAHRSAAAVCAIRSPEHEHDDIDRKTSFASNASENVAVKPRPLAGMLAESQIWRCLDRSDDRMHFLFTMSKIRQAHCCDRKLLAGQAVVVVRERSRR